MKNLFIGLALGIVLCGLACYFVIPTIKQTAYDNGYNAGNKKGVSTGTAAGITQGIAEIQAQQKHERDSIATVEKNEAMQRAVHMRRKVPPTVQNWHVIDGKLADPVSDNIEKKPK